MLQLAVSVALALAAAPPSGRAADGDRRPRLGVELRLDPRALPRPLAIEPERARDATPPACVADWCQARVDVPGIGLPRQRASKTELFVALLDRAQLEPVASIAWFFVVTGLRVDWSPANMDESFGATAGGWGNVFVRLRVRIDAWNRPSVPLRPRERLRRERELAAARERARDLERLRGLAAPAAPAADRVAPVPAADQRPARLSRT